MKARIKETGELINVVPIKYVEFGSKQFEYSPREFNSNEILLEKDIPIIGESYNDLMIKDVSNRVSDSVYNKICEQLNKVE